jgi:hypothetical protein
VPVDAQQIAELAARIESAGGPDRELDAEVWLFVAHKGMAAGEAVVSWRQDQGCLALRTASGYRHLELTGPAFTASEDAARDLREFALPGWGFFLEACPAGETYGRRLLDGRVTTVRAYCIPPRAAPGSLAAIRESTTAYSDHPALAATAAACRAVATLLPEA